MTKIWNFEKLSLFQEHSVCLPECPSPYIGCVFVLAGTRMIYPGRTRLGCCQKNHWNCLKHNNGKTPDMCWSTYGLSWMFWHLLNASWTKMGQSKWLTSIQWSTMVVIISNIWAAVLVLLQNTGISESLAASMAPVRTFPCGNTTPVTVHWKVPSVKKSSWVDSIPVKTQHLSLFTERYRKSKSLPGLTASLWKHNTCHCSPKGTTSLAARNFQWDKWMFKDKTWYCSLLFLSILGL